MSYAELVEPGMVPDGQVALHVAEDAGIDGVAKAGYQVLRVHGQAELVAEGRSVGVMTMARLMPIVLTLSSGVRGRYGTRTGVPRSGSGSAPTRPESAIRLRCPVCGTTAYVLGERPVSCRVCGHGPISPAPGR